MIILLLIIKLKKPVFMAQELSYNYFYSNSNYQSVEFSYENAFQGNKEITHSNQSTRKSSADSIDSKAKFKTEMCKYFLLKKECPFSELCLFAHGEQQLRSKGFLPSNYKTRECSKFSSEGYCLYGKRCQFIHFQGNSNIKYERLVETIKNDSNMFYEYFNSIARRLPFFQQMKLHKGIEEMTETKSAIACIAAQGLVNRTRYNSF